MAQEDKNYRHIELKRLGGYFADIEISFESISKLKNKTFLITGGTGFLGSLLTRYLLFLNSEYNSEIKIILPVKNMQKAEEMYCDVKSDVEFVSGDIRSLPPIKQTIDFIFHFAANTKSADMVKYPVETADGIVVGTKNILEFARKKKVESMVYISSMEVYGGVESSSGGTSEDELGQIDILSARSCYPLGKRMAENYCYSYFSEYGVPVKTARLAQTFGAGVLPQESRVFAQFARCAMDGKNIVLHTKGDSTGNYVDTMDLISALFVLLFDGENGEAYNVANETASMTILEMARLVADKVADGRIKVEFDIPKDNEYGYAAKTGLRLSSKKMRSLGWTPKYGMEEMYRRMIDWMK